MLSGKMNSSIFTDSELSGLSKTVIKRSAQLEAKFLQTYNDLLFTHIMENVRARKSNILSALTRACETMESRTDWAHTSLWTFSATKFNHSLKERAIRMSSMSKEEVDDFIMEEQLVKDKIRKSGDDWTMSVRGAFGGDFNILPPVRIARVVKNTDLLDRIAAEFGDKFFVDTRTEWKEEFETYDSHEITLRLLFFPNGLRGRDARVRAETNAKYAEHELYTIPPYDIMIIDNGECECASTIESNSTCSEMPGLSAW